MSSLLTELIGMGLAEPSCRPWPRAVVNHAGWAAAIECLAQEDLRLADLWGEAGAAHMALLDEAAGGLAIVSFEAPGRGGFPSVGVRHAPAIRLERAVRDLHGLRAENARDDRPWLDHGRWGRRSRAGGAA